MATPLTDSINALTAYANEVTGKQDTTLSDAVGSLVEGYGGFDLLQTLTFVDALGNSGRQTVEIPQSWDKYDFILFVPDLMITAQEGQTTGNWLWYEVRNKTTNIAQSNYDGDGGVGARKMGRYTAIISKGEIVNNGLGFMMSCWISGRMASIRAATDDKFSDLKIKYGTYYDGTYGLLNGTVKIYGGKF